MGGCSAAASRGFNRGTGQDPPGSRRTGRSGAARLPPRYRYGDGAGDRETLRAAKRFPWANFAALR